MLVACRLAGLSAPVATMTASMREGNPAKRPAFASLADRLDALAAERAKPWWRRLAG